MWLPNIQPFSAAVHLIVEFPSKSASQVLAQHSPGQPLPAPTFEEFAMSMKSTSVPEWLNSDQPILDSEIQQITVKELNHKIHTAEATIQAPKDSEEEDWGMCQ